ncbi:AMP-binding protein [Bordetella genomosp. 13]|uniref:AMP-binding protein n=1 Tax=Bordetella genomosp. 13 TaxID=463040 RepID=UPI00119D5F40|nr:AMP-binding protein [Bordetella genomosp. 13]
MSSQPIRLAQLYAPALQRHPDAMALSDEAGPLSWREFDRLCRRTAGWLAAQGVKRGDRVAVWLPNRREWLALLFGLARLGATLVSINVRYRSAELQYILGRSEARMLIMQPSFRKLDFPAVLSDIDPASLPALQTIVLVDGDDTAPSLMPSRATLAYAPETAQEHVDDAAEDPNLPVILFTTSGTTKGPKLVMHSATTLSAHTRQVAPGFGLTGPDARLLAALPLCGVFGLNSVLGALHAGAPIVMMDLFDAGRAARLLRDERITHMYGSDEMLRRIAAEVDGEDVRPFPHIRVFGFAAFHPGSVELAARLEKRGFPMSGLYGSSEVQALFAIQDSTLPVAQRALGGGQPAAGTQAHVRVRDQQTGVLCEPGGHGEIEIRAPGNFIGYLDNPEATADALTTDGYFRTGDMGYVRGDGSFVYLARIGDALRLGGFLVDPAEIEYALTSQPGVHDAQVVGITLDGQPRAVAFVIVETDAKTDSSADARPDRQANALLDTLKATLAPFKVPARLWIVDAFPVTSSANGEKIQRNRLRQMAEERLQQETPA